MMREIDSLAMSPLSTLRFGFPRDRVPESDLRFCFPIKFVRTRIIDPL
jgi:hypothetical protein